MNPNEHAANRPKAELFAEPPETPGSSGCANLWGRNPEEARERWFDEHDQERATQDVEQAALNAHGPLPPISPAESMCVRQLLSMCDSLEIGHIEAGTTATSPCPVYDRNGELLGYAPPITAADWRNWEGRP